jgi:hypothetical protein
MRANRLQAMMLANKTTFRNCLVAMHLSSIKADLPSTHNMTQFIHNEFVALLNKYKL